MQIIYKADDGTVFSDRYECEEYERKQKESAVKIWGLRYCNCRSMMELINSQEESNFAEAVGMIWLKTQEEADVFCEMCSSNGLFYCGIDGPGIYIYQDSDIHFPIKGNIDSYFSWVRIEEILNFAKSTIQLMEDYKNLLTTAK